MLRRRRLRPIPPVTEEEANTYEEPQYGFSALFTQPQFLAGLSGVNFERVAGITWEQIEKPPGSGTFDWDDIDHYVIPACANGYNIHIVLKVAHPVGLVDTACYNLAINFVGSATNVKGPRLVSCPLLPQHLDKWKTFIKKVIRRYCLGPSAPEAMPGLTSAFRMHIQIENEASSKIFWNIDIVSDGALAAQNYAELLRVSYEAKTEEGATNCKIILQGFPELDNVADCLSDPNYPGRNCGIPASLRLRTFAQEILKIDYKNYYDVIDCHWFNYFYFVPGRVAKGTAWLRDEIAANGWSLDEKELWCNESTPAMIKDPGATIDGPEVLAAYYPYRDEVPLVAGYLDPIRLFNADGTEVPTGDDGDAVAPCYFLGEYTATDIDRTIAIAMTALQGAQTPQQFQWTRNFIGINTSVWTGPVNCSITPISLTDGISVVWSATTGIAYPFGVSTRAHLDPGVSDPHAQQDLLRSYYSNLDFLENPPAPGIVPALYDPKHRIWFEAEEAIDCPKHFCDLMINGYKRIKFTKFPNYYYGFSWDEMWWRFHGVIRILSGTGPDDVVFVHKPSWHSRNQLLDFVAGHIGHQIVTDLAGLTVHKFSFVSGVPKYVIWTTATNLLDDLDRVDGPVVCEDVTIALATAFGWHSARVTEFCFEVVNDVPTLQTQVVTGDETYTIGDRTHTVSGDPVTHKSIAVMVEKID